MVSLVLTEDIWLILAHRQLKNNGKAVVLILSDEQLILKCLSEEGRNCERDELKQAVKDTLWNILYWFPHAWVCI
jgi:hypothetical protein